MGTVWEATKLMLMVYGIAAVVSFLVAWVIKLTFAAIRMHSARGAPPVEAPVRAPAAAAKAGPEKAA